MPNTTRITEAARNTWLNSDSPLAYADWLEITKAQGRYWGAV